MSAAVALKGKPVMDKKIVSISSKRQITIPQKYFAALGFTDEAECILRDGEIIIRPARIMSGGEFAEQILTELVSAGFSGDELVAEFKRRQAQIRPAVEKLIDEADAVAEGCGEYFTYDDVFGREDSE